MEQQLYIPSIGDELQLTKDWHCKIQEEYRNNDALLVLIPSLSKQSHSWKGLLQNGRAVRNYTEFSVIIPKDTILKIDRIYIKKGASDFDSITFYAALPNAKKKIRFWVSLSEANKIKFTSITPDNKKTVKNKKDIKI